MLAEEHGTSVEKFSKYHSESLIRDILMIHILSDEYPWLWLLCYNAKFLVDTALLCACTEW